MFIGKRIKFYNRFKEGRCAHCGKYENLTIDHFIPKSCGMAVNEQGNYVGLCVECNRIKGNKIVTPNWYPYLEKGKMKILDRYMRYASTYIKANTEDKEVLAYLEKLIENFNNKK